MDYMQKLKYHYTTKKGWINDPNGLVYFKGYYHIFYQHAPNFEIPWQERMHWGHAVTKDFITFEELPVALYPETDYDCRGCWSGTAIVKDDTMYLFYASITKDNDQTVSIAYSKDGINFTKYEKNPVIDHYPADGSKDFRDPAVCEIDGKYYCVMASAHVESKKARLLLYKSENLLDWTYVGVMCEWDECRYAECPSFMQTGDKFLLSASVDNFDGHYFSVMYGDFKDDKFTIEHKAEVDKGPDQYAGQIFKDHKGRCILISWIPGWQYQGYVNGKDIGCMSVPREFKLENGKITAYPIDEIRHLLKDSDDALIRTENGFTVNREGRTPLVYEGEINDLKVIRDGYVMEIFVNGGQEVYTVIL
jgi:beta-fructofuranosidase